MNSHPKAIIADPTRYDQYLHDEFRWTIHRVSPLGLMRLWGITILLLIVDKLNLRPILKKLTPWQRAVLALIALVAGGSAIVLLIIHNQLGLALVIMFLLGWMVNEISRL